MCSMVGVRSLFNGLVRISEMRCPCTDGGEAPDMADQGSASDFLIG